ncbi:MAG: hypothetical protein RBU30_25345, partial [Polyangia bacterium]|nr:hypothetical protein [Polyangia bacterium]
SPGVPRAYARSYALRSPPLSAPGAGGGQSSGALAGNPARSLGEAEGSYGVGSMEARREGEGPWPFQRAQGTFGGLVGKDRALPQGSLGRHRYLGQLLRTYLLLEGDGELILVDQHAAHERITYGRLKQAFGGGAVKMQRLLFPLRLTLEQSEEALCEERRDVLARCGFEVELLSGRTAALRAVPALLTEVDPERLFRDVLGELEGQAGEATLDQISERLLATMACHSSVRAGQWLGDAEVAALLAALDETERSGHCPHGRPVVVRLDEAELRRRFGRE